MHTTSRCKHASNRCKHASKPSKQAGKQMVQAARRAARTRVCAPLDVLLPPQRRHPIRLDLRGDARARRVTHGVATVAPPRPAVDCSVANCGHDAKARRCRSAPMPPEQALHNWDALNRRHTVNAPGRRSRLPGAPPCPPPTAPPRRCRATPTRRRRRRPLRRRPPRGRAPGRRRR